MKPIKPKKMPKAARTWLEDIAKQHPEWSATLTPRVARAILAALEYERQRADEAVMRSVAAQSELERIRPSHWHD